MPRPTDTALLTAATDATTEAGRFLLDAFVERPTRPPARTWPEFRAAFDRLDGPAAAILRGRLAAAAPGTRWADELDAALPATGEFWVVDPLDGAVQFLQGLPQWSVSVTLVRDGRAVLTSLHNPLLQETYTALRGAGARRNGQEVRPSAKTSLELAVVGTSQPPFAAKQPAAIAEAGRSLSAVLPAVGVVRNLGPTSWQVADVAAGRMDAFWEHGRDDANLVGAALVVAEAGGVVADAGGEPWRAGASSFVAGPAALVRQLTELVGA